MADKEYTIDPKNMGLLDSIRTVAGHVGAGIVDIPAMVPRVYDLYSKLASVPAAAAIPILGPAMAAHNLTRGEDGLLPGQGTLNKWGDEWTEKSLEIGADIAGRKIVTGTPWSNDPNITTADMVGSAASILTNMIPVTGGPAKLVLNAASNFKTGLKLVDDAAPIVVKAASFLSPLAITNSPKTLIAANAVLGGSIAGAVDLAGNDERTKKAQVDAENKLYAEQLTGANDVAQKQIQVGVDKSVSAAGEALDAKKQMDVVRTQAQTFSLNDFAKGTVPAPASAPAAPKTFSLAEFSQPVADVTKPAPVSTGFDFGEHQNIALVTAGLALTGAVAGVFNKSVRKKALEFFGGEEFGKKGLEDAVSKTNASNLNVWDVIKTQSIDASTPLLRESSNPEKMRILAEQKAVATLAHFSKLHSEGVFDGSNVRLARTLTETVDDFNTVFANPAKRESVIRTMNALAEQDNQGYAFLKSDKRPAGLNSKHSVDDVRVQQELDRLIARERAAVSSTSPTYADDIAKIENQFAFNKFDPATGMTQARADLIRDIRTGMADPDVARLVNSYKDITRKSLDYMLEQKAITKREHADLLRAHPNYFPVRSDATHMSPLELSSTGGRLLRGDPTKELFPYLQEVVRSVANEKLKTGFVTDVINSAAAGNKRARELLGRTDLRPDQVNNHNRAKLTLWRDDAGVQRVAEFRDPLVRYALNANAGTAALRMTEGAMKWLAAPARFTEAVNTGPLTAFVGSAFAPIGAAYSTLGVLLNRPAGSAAGLIDKFVQDYVSKPMGMKFGVRGDPTYLLQVGTQMATGVMSILAKNAAGALENVVKSSSWMSGTTSPGTMDLMAKSLSNLYKASTIHAMEQRGLYGGATLTATRTAPTMQDLENGLSATTRLSKGWQSTRNFVHDILGAIGNAPQAAYYKQNVGRMADDVLVTRTRNVLGDPAKSGAATSGFGKMAVGGTVITPWGNVAVQSLVALGESFKRNPHGTAMAITTSVALPSILITNWNAQLGPEYVKHQFMTRTPDQVSGSHYLGIIGLKPEQGLEIPIDQPMRIFKVLADILHGYQTGLADGSLWDAKNERMKDAFMDATKTRYYDGPFSDAMSSAIGQVLFPLPSVGNVFMAAVGSNQIGRNYIDSPTAITPNKKAGATESTSKTIDNKWFGRSVSAEFEAVFNSLGGQVARAVSDTLTGAFGGARQGLSRSDIISDAGEKIEMRTDKSLRMVSGLWGSASTISPSQEASTKALQELREGMDKLSQASEKLRSIAGNAETLVGAKGRSIDTRSGPGPVPFKDAPMTQLGFFAQSFMNKQYAQHAGEISSLYEQRNSAMSSEKLSPRLKQQLVNSISKDIITANEKALAAVEQWKWGVSKKLGYDIDLRKLKVDEPITQFKPLLPTDP